jgi:predicted nucleic acid-binding protein
MRIVLDTNEYVLGLGEPADETAAEVLDRIVGGRQAIELRIVRAIADEVRANLPEKAHRRFFRIVSRLTSIDENWIVPDDLLESYRGHGLKPGDANIAAYAQYVAADYLVSENRHFLSRRENLPFQVVTGKEFLAVLEGREQ